MAHPSVDRSRRIVASRCQLIAWCAGGKGAAGRLGSAESLQCPAGDWRAIEVGSASRWRSLMRWFCWITLVALLAIGADEPKPDAVAKDLEAMQGIWTMVSFEVNGEALPEGQVKTGR